MLQLPDEMNDVMKKYLCVSVCVPVLLSACASPHKESGREAVKVEEYEVRANMSSSPSVHYVGQVEENYSAALSFPRGGLVKEVYVAPGDKVAKGDVLAIMDKTAAESALDAARASLVQARDAYSRLKQVYDSGSLAEVKWIEIQTKLQQAEAVEKSARKILEDCDLKAPFAGVVSSRNAESGMNMLPSQPVVVLSDIASVRIRISVPENEIAGINLGQKAKVGIAALGNGIFTGEVVEKGVKADNLSHSYPVRISVDNVSGQIMPGMVCKVILENNGFNHGFSVPAAAIGIAPEGRYLWVDSCGVAKRRFVETGDFDGNKVWIENGLDEGDKVIVSGFLKLNEGCAVQAVEADSIS